MQYVRATAVSSVRPVARSVVDSERKARVYASMTGDKSQPEIAAATGVPQTTVSRFQRDFLTAGLATPPSNSYHFARALFTLDELGLSDLIKPSKTPEDKGESSSGGEAGA